MSIEEKRDCVDYGNQDITVSRQCELLQLARSSLYYQTQQVRQEDKHIMDKIDEIFTAHPIYGSRRMKATLLREHQLQVNRKKIQRLMRLMGIEAIYPKPNLSKKHPSHKIYPYLLRGLKISYPNHVWSLDITYIRLLEGWIYLVAIIDWYSRYIVNWEISITLEIAFCLDVIDGGYKEAIPQITNVDQGSHFTSPQFTSKVEGYGSQISMDGRGRALDNIMIERFWRSLKYEQIYLHEYVNVEEAYRGIKDYVEFYNLRRPHQSLNYQTPYEVYSKGKMV